MHSYNSDPCWECGDIDGCHLKVTMNTEGESIELKHHEMVSALCKPGPAILADLDQRKAFLIHMAMGLSGEAGEVLDTVKKHCIYNKDLDHGNLKEELGDLEFFMAGMRQCLGLTREEILQANIAKLSVRYAAGKYTNEQAQARADKV